MPELWARIAEILVRMPEFHARMPEFLVTTLEIRAKLSDFRATSCLTYCLFEQKSLILVHESYTRSSP